MSWNIILDMSWNIWLKWNDPSPFPSALQYNCVEMHGYSDMMNVGTWKTNYCTAERGFICEAWKGTVERKKLVAKFNMIKTVILIFLTTIKKPGNLTKNNESNNH